MFRFAAPVCYCFVVAITPTIAFSQTSSLQVRADGIAASHVPAVSKVLQARADGLRTASSGATTATVEGNLVTLTFSGWSPAPSLTSAAVTSKRTLRLVVEPSSDDILLTESDVADARPGIRTTPELALRLNDSGMEKLRKRGKSLVGKIVSVYWDDVLISRPKVNDELVRDVAITVPSQDVALLVATVLRAGPLPEGASQVLTTGRVDSK